MREIEREGERERERERETNTATINQFRPSNVFQFIGNEQQNPYQLFHFKVHCHLYMDEIFHVIYMLLCLVNLGQVFKSCFNICTHDISE